MSALWIFFALLSIVGTGNTEGTARSFIVDYENDRFLKDGEPFRYVSGSLHYFRVPKSYWKDRMTKMKLAGLNALQTYVEWSGHEPEPGKYVFEDNYDLKTFLETAQETLVLARTVKRVFDAVKRAQGKGPLIVTEYYPGWLDHWGAPHAKIDTKKMLETFEEILQFNASVNFYMFHGGTNFGFSNGKNPPPQPTSYDYGAPLSEAGDPRDAYYKIRNITSKYLPLPPGNPPAPAPKLNLGTVEFTASSSLQEMLNFFRQYAYLTNATSLYPITFEELGQDFGYVVYTTTIEFQPRSPTALAVPGISDRGYVYTRATRAVLSNDHLTYSVPVVVQKGENLTIIVENTGRINFGSGNKDLKGIVSNVTLGGHLLTNWTMEGVPLSTPGQLSLLSKFLTTLNGEPKFEVPGVFFGYFMLPRGQEPLDTFLDPTGFGKGVAILNGVNLGRYWPSIGPQVTLYVPGTLLLPYPQVNLVALFEMESAPEGLKTVKFVDVPTIDGPTPT
ncbi:hypothetical protein HPB47_020797 [Ixodes persulcatus]|uniref:Uncharacterized protein n=1 Tax=Ixodes persulcatus TaxID=34615 RepID=A0AC60QGL2_IXOPE|nr:hypothetical protein HPB47_020797 [Ixodes persulcatus]